MSLLLPGAGVRDRVQRFLERPGTADLTRYRALVTEAGEQEEELRALSDSELADAAETLTVDRARVPARLVRACALAREAGRRTLGERAYDEQLLGGLGMLHGHVVEMATGEGKTLAGAIAAAGFALQGKRVHVISVNDYLAERDAGWMSPMLRLLGISVGSVGQHSRREQRAEAYDCMVTYVSVSEAGFDVLRDRLRTDAGELVLPEPEVAVVDEADSVMVDEARIPLVLAGTVADPQDGLQRHELVRELDAGSDYRIEAGRTVTLTDAGVERLERRLGGIDLYTTEHADTLAGINVALYAHTMVRRDVDYLVRDGQVQLINPARGRVALRQRWPDGLQAAVESKEGLRRTAGGQALDWMTVQSLIGRYPTVCGMSGSAVAAATEMREFFGVEVGVVPRHETCERIDEPDQLYDTDVRRDVALLRRIRKAHDEGRPVLVGTSDVAASEQLAAELSEAGVEAAVLNAKNDAEEAEIIAAAGKRGAVTISTQMAGRGVDIRLGGRETSPGDAAHAEIAELGGLLVIGSGRYHTSRLDDQLRGRAGRQGDPGAAAFFTSLTDELVQRNVRDLRTPKRVEHDGRVTERSAQRVVEHAQRVAEGAHLTEHRTTWHYNELLAKQREAVLRYRDRVLSSELADTELTKACPQRHAELAERWGAEQLAREARRLVLLHIDRRWSEHLGYLDELREGIHLRALGRENPLQAYQQAAGEAFRGFFDEVREHAAESFEAAEASESGLDLEAMGLLRASETWTYMITDRSLGESAEGFLRGVGLRIRDALQRE